MRRLIAICFVSALAGLAACGGNEVEDWEVLMPDATSQSVTYVEGTVNHIELEGGFFVIRSGDSTAYNPRNLPEEFRVDGMRVEADVIVRDDMASIHMVGPMVDIVRLRRVADGD